MEKDSDFRNLLSNNSISEGIVNGFNAIDQIMQSDRNGQWDRNMLEWMVIPDTALKEITFVQVESIMITQNKKVYLSP